MPDTAIAQRLSAGVAQLPFDVPAGAQQQMLQYLALMLKWNKAYNLTAIRDPDDMVVKHLLDSLSIVPWVKDQNLLDIGTGGGLPGIPLAILFPQLQVTLLDSNSKKTRFLSQVKIELGLTNVTVVHARIEQFQPSVLFQQIVSRAFSALDQFAALALPKLATGGCLLAMKGQMPQEEISALKVEAMQVDVVPLAVPMLAEARHLVIMQPQQTNYSARS